MEKKKIILICVIVLLVVLLPVGIFVGLSVVATNNAKELMESMKNYAIPYEELVTGKYVDFSSDKNLFTKTKVDEGIVYIDQDGTVQILSNVKIGGFYCTYGEKVSCSLTNKKDTNIAEVKEYTEYSVGDAVTLKDNTKWHVIHDSDKYSKYVVLLRDERVDYNNDGFTVDTSTTSDPDRIPFDKNGQKKYDVTSVGNIGYYIENTYKPSLTLLNNVLDVRLLSTKEYEAIKDKIGFSELTESQILNMTNTEELLLESIQWMYESPRPVDRLKNIVITQQQYDMLMPHWLHNASSGNYWVIKENGKPCTTVWSGSGYTTPKVTTGYSLKPVLVIEKSNI